MTSQKPSPIHNDMHLTPTIEGHDVSEQRSKNDHAGQALFQQQQSLIISPSSSQSHLDPTGFITQDIPIHSIRGEGVQKHMKEPWEYSHNSSDLSFVPSLASTSAHESPAKSRPHAAMHKEETFQGIEKEGLIETGFASKEITPEFQSLFENSCVVGSEEHEGEPFDISSISELVSNVKISPNATRARPLLCQNITNSKADTLRISHLPRSVTYEKLYAMVKSFGEVEDLVWSALDPYVCNVTYRDSAAAHEAKHFLHDALIGTDSEPPLKAELWSGNLGAQLFVGDLTSNITEEMLEDAFSKLVGEPVTAVLKRDPDNFSPIGYGFLTFKSESSANYALVAGHRVKIGNACVRVGRAERNTHLYVSDLSVDVSMEDLKEHFGKFGNLVEEDSVIIRSSYAFIRYKNRTAAERAKGILDRTDLKGNVSVHCVDEEGLKACVTVQFLGPVPSPAKSLRDLLFATFSKYGNCSLAIPHLTNPFWRKEAYVTFHGHPISAHLAAVDAVQSVHFVSSLPVHCDFSQELPPRISSVCDGSMDFSSARHGYWNGLENPSPQKVWTERNDTWRGIQSDRMDGRSRSCMRAYDDRFHEYCSWNHEHTGYPNVAPVYMPIIGVQHPNHQVSQQEYETGNVFPSYHG